MAFRGDLQEIGLFDVFQNVHHNRLTGTLRVENGTETRWIHLHEGLVRHVSLGEGIGLPMPEFLVQRGFVDAKALDRVLRSRGRSRRLLQDLLARAKVLDPGEYERAFRLRVEEFLFDLLSWKKAEFEFLEGPPPRGIFDLQQKSLSLALDPSSFLMEAARREDEWQRIRRVVSSDFDFFEALGEEEPPEDPETVMIWRALDGRTELRELQRTLPLGRFEIHDTIARLVTGGFARPVPPTDLPALAREAVENGDPERAEALLTRVLEIERNHREARGLLAEVLESRGRCKDAAVHHAFLGSQSMQEGEARGALASFREAVRLDPADAGLRERVFDLQRELGDAEEFEAAALGLSEQLEMLGLVERACEVLDGARKRPDMALRPRLLERWGALMAQTGHAEAGAGTFLGIAKGLEEAGDRFGAMRTLEVALRLYPDSRDLKRLREDVESDRRNRRIALRRRLFRWGAGAAVAGLLLVLAGHELVLRRRTAALLASLPRDVAQGRAHQVLGLLEAFRKAAPLAPSQFLLRDLERGLREAGALEAARAERVLGAASAARIEACLAGPPR